MGPSPEAVGRRLFYNCAGQAYACAVLFFCLDLNSRSTTLVPDFSPREFFANALWMGTALGGLALLWALVLYLAEWVGRRVGRAQRAGELALALSYALFIYLNLLFLRLYLGVFSHLPFASVSYLCTALLPLGWALYPLVRRRLDPDMLALLPGLGRLGVWGTGLGVVVLSASMVLTPAPRRGRPPVDKPHILLLTCDSLSALNMSLYGYPRPTTPALERWARQAYTFEQAIANANTTYYALPCLLGLLPVGNGSNPPVLTRALAENGYRHRIFAACTGLPTELRNTFTEVSRFGFGSDLPPMAALRALSPATEADRRWLGRSLSSDIRFFNLLDPRHPRDFNLAPGDPYPMHLYLDHARERLRSPEPSFIWIHCFQPHEPAHTRPPFTGLYGDSRVDRYDAAVTQMDQEVGAFLQSLHEEGLDQCTLVVFSSDHGESFTREEGGWTGRLHGTNWLNEAVCHIPLVIRMPGQSTGGTISTFTQQADLAPTLLAVLGLSSARPFPGEAIRLDRPGQVSEQLKLTVPESYFQRAHQRLDPSPGNWVTGSEEMFAAYLQPYKVGWFQLYAHASGSPPGYLTEYRDSLIYGVFDLSRDPHATLNLLDHDKPDPALVKLLSRVFGDPLVAACRHLP